MEITWIGSPNSRTRTGQVKFITLHWMVGRLAGTDAVFQKYPGTATHYGIEGDRVHQYVLESRAAPGTGSNAAIPYDITIEHAGGWLLPDGSRMKPTPLTHQTSAELCAGIARRWGLGKLVVGRNVFRHRDWVSTSCPGSLEVEWIVAKANEINGFGTSTAGGISGAINADARWIQERLIVHGFNPGDVDGDWGPLTEAAVKAFQTANNLDPDGVVGPITKSALEGEPHMSAADVAALKTYIKSETERLANYVRREARPRLYIDKTTKQVLAVRLETGYLREFDNLADANVLKSDPYGLLAPEAPVEVDSATYDSIKAEVRHAQNAIVDLVVDKLGTGAVSDIAKADIVDAVSTALADLSWKLTAE